MHFVYLTPDLTPPPTPLFPAFIFVVLKTSSDFISPGIRIISYTTHLRHPSIQPTIHLWFFLVIFSVFCFVFVFVLAATTSLALPLSERQKKQPLLCCGLEKTCNHKSLYFKATTLWFFFVHLLLFVFLFFCLLVALFVVVLGTATLGYLFFWSDFCICAVHCYNYGNYYCGFHSALPFSKRELRTEKWELVF